MARPTAAAAPDQAFDEVHPVVSMCVGGAAVGLHEMNLE